MPSPKQLLVEHLYTGDLPADVREMSKSGRSWRDIAETISTDVNLTVSYESLRTWYGQVAA